MVALIGEWEDREKREDLRFGVLAAAVYQTAFKRQDGGHWVPADFFPSLRVGPTPEQLEADEQEQKIAFLRLMGAPPEIIGKVSNA